MTGGDEEHALDERVEIARSNTHSRVTLDSATLFYGPCRLNRRSRIGVTLARVVL